MKNRIIGFLLVIAFMFTSGCATIMHGKFQTIPITSTPFGAMVQANTGEQTTTPGTLTLIRNRPVVLMAELEGYEPMQQKLQCKTAGWMWGNILAGGIIGVAIDHSSGAGKELTPKDVHFQFIKKPENK